METKLESVLRNFSANPSPNKFRRDTILGAKNKFKAMKALNTAQRYINTFGGVGNLAGDQILIDVLPDVNMDVLSNPEKINQYLPKGVNDKFQARIDKVKNQYPLDESKKGTWDYESNRSLREDELRMIDEDKARALLEYAKLSNTKKKLKGLDKEYYE